VQRLVSGGAVISIGSIAADKGAGAAARQITGQVIAVNSGARPTR